MDLGNLGERSGDPAGHIDSELFDAKTAGYEVLDVLVDAAVQ